MTLGRPENTAIVTIVSNNYIHFARTMLQSAKHHHQDYAFYCVIVDSDQSHATALDHEFEVIHLNKLNLPLGEEFLFQYNILELNTAVKPWAIEYLLMLGHENVIYVDPDIYFYGRMSDVQHMLSSKTDIVLTPHLLAPITDEKLPRELDIRRAGAYNFGFCAMRNSANTRNFLLWWQAKLTRDCVNDADRGLFVDQSWIDLVPGLFENVSILRNKGYNVAYWNIAQRPLVRQSDDRYFIGEEPLIFFHFSGLDLVHPETFSKHQDRFTLSTVGIAKDLVESYVKAVMANGYNNFAKLSYGFKYFSNGEEIPEAFRKLYRASNILRKRMEPYPFDCASVMCELWLEISIDGVSPTNAMMALWQERRDVQFEFPMSSASSILAYYRWFTSLPTAATYYPQSVISYHKQLIARFDKKEKKQTAQPEVQMQMWRGREKRAHSLYKHILARAPDEGGFLAYSELCKTDAGFVRAWGEIGLSAESKKKRFLWLRMLKALLFSIYIVNKRTPDLSDPHLLEQGELSSKSVIGVFPAEADVSTLGVWVTDKVVVPINARHGDRIELKGFYFPESIEKQTGGGESYIRISAGDDEIYSAQLGTYGDFILECMLPTSHKAGLTTLTVETSKVFVPQSIGLGEDERRLAWRLKTLSIGAKSIFDCAREETFPEEIKSTRPADVDSFNFELPQLAYSGFFQAEADSETLGVWVSANIVVPIVPSEGERIRMLGVYFPHSIAKATGNNESTIRFIVGGKELHSIALKAQGDFTIDFTLPKMSDDSSASLHIHCSNSFVPKNIGEGHDDRTLSWRLKTLTAGKITVFDCNRQNVTTSNRRFVPRMTHNPDFSKSKIKLFAFYLPQISHSVEKEVEVLNKTVGWAQVSNAISQYADHHQPQLPIELGFYDYRSAGVLKRQVSLAKQYGVSGFCFHHLWSAPNPPSGQPLNTFLADSSLDIQFCICWDTEKDSLQTRQLVRRAEPFSEDSAAFLSSIAPAFDDVRYQKVDLKPILIMSSDLNLTDPAKTVSDLQKFARQIGLPGLYLIALVLKNTRGWHECGFDAVINSPQSGFGTLRQKIAKEKELGDAKFAGRRFDYDELAKLPNNFNSPDTVNFEAVTPSWDTEVLEPGMGTSLVDATPEAYAKWLTRAISATSQTGQAEKLLFINAWNAWSEGAHLEADQRYGYGYLHATASVLLNQLGAQNAETIRKINSTFVRRNEAVVIAHIYYEDLIDSIFDSYLAPQATQCDLIVTVMNDVSLDSLQKIKQKFDNCFIVQTPNRGRDIRPFVIAYRLAYDFGYLYACKIHTKKSLQRHDGEKWRTSLLDSLMQSTESVANILKVFKTDHSLGLIVPSGWLYDLSSPNMYSGNVRWLNALLIRMGQEEIIGKYTIHFPAGSMYWFRVDALSQLLEETFVSISEFELEAGQVDGTLAHTLERLTGLMSDCNGYKTISDTPANDGQNFTRGY
jgi:lipopolysaccharide biosynthesis protein